MSDLFSAQSLSSTSDEAVDLYRTAVEQILGSESGAAENLDRALQLDPAFALAAAARYSVAKDSGEEDADRFRQQAEAAAGQVSAAEQAHIRILIGLIDRPAEIRSEAEAYIHKTPTDRLAVAQLGGYLFFYGGPDKLNIVLNLFESVYAALPDDWALLARLGFAASEAGRYQRGRELLQRALKLRPQALYSIHALAHLLHDEGAAAESALLLRDWLDQYGAGALQGQMYGHVQWHLALSEWQVGERDAAIRRYQQYCAPETTTCGPILTLADCGGFLLRDYLKSAEAKPLDRSVQTHIDKVWRMLGHPFIALHVAGLYASAEDRVGLQRCHDAVSEGPEGKNRSLSLALIDALSCYVTGDYAAAEKLLGRMTPGERIGIGGSNVERILIDLLEQQCQLRG